MTSRFTDKVVVIGGGGHGIGRACAERFCAEGAKTIVFDIDEAAAEATVSGIVASGGQARALSVDVSDEDAVAEAAQRVLGETGRVDVLHNHAGLLIPGDAVGQTVQDWDRSFAVNIRSMFLMVHAFLPSMLDAGGGAIVNTGSTVSVVGEQGVAAYGASNGAVVGLTRQLAADFSRRGVRVNCVCPGWVPTGFNDPFLEGMAPEEIQEIVEAQVPVGRQGTPEEIAAAVAFLASDEASFVIGQILSVDGGVAACR